MQEFYNNDIVLPTETAKQRKMPPKQSTEESGSWHVLPIYRKERNEQKC